VIEDYKDYDTLTPGLALAFTLPQEKNVKSARMLNTTLLFTTSPTVDAYVSPHC